MKKLMIGLVGAVALAVNAQAEIASENIVGYETKGIVAGDFNMFSVPFKLTNGNGFSLNKNLSLKNATSGASATQTDNILIWGFNKQGIGGYTTYYLYEYDPNEPDYPTGWYNLVGDTSFDEDYPDGLPAGTAFWYLAKDSTTEAEISFAGEVDLSSTKEFNLVKGDFNMLAYPFPQPFSINKNLNLENATAGASATQTDNILIWGFNEKGIGGYSTYYLYEYDPEEPDYPAGWYNLVGDTSFDEDYPNGLPAGTAFWYLSKAGEGSIKATFTK